ncbi:CG30 [Parapoynx stagnalis nucleopolyhedrovirus]|uniref:CG30 n=1 Tax=Parapoynx stagnalis nucleopolyhedrovirus TaxID=2993413 RepID=A0A9E8C360_9ABAC|nr:CG30 [Parapoynx stagnalis nucleopolyhedrovirus]
MEVVKFQCNICWSVAEIKQNINIFSDNIYVLPIAELCLCKHQLCLACIRKIRAKKKLVCPMCRCENFQFNIYNVTGNNVDFATCYMEHMKEWAQSLNNIDVASLGSFLFENSLCTEEDEKNNDTPDLVKLSQLKEEIVDQNIKYTKQLVELKKIQEECDSKKKIILESETKIAKLRCDYLNILKKNKSLKLKQITAQKALESINREHVKLVTKNQTLMNQNKMLINKNIELIKHRNILEKEYTNLTHFQ